MYDVVIIGSGIAGLTSAIYSARAGHKTIVIGGPTLGGQIINTLHVENYPGYKDISGFDLINNIASQVKELGVEIVSEEAKEITSDKKVITENNTYSFKSLIIATGLENRSLGLENEKKFLGMGVSVCATCDGNFFRGRDVAIVGGGNTALEDALYLANICNKVYLIHRRNTFTAEKYYVDKVYANSKIELCLSEEVKSINGEDSLQGITLTSGRELNIDGLFVAIGKVPNSKLYENLVETDNGYIVSNEKCTTSVPYIFVAGDCRKKSVRQLVTAASDGAVAALSASKYLEREK